MVAHGPPAPATEVKAARDAEIAAKLRALGGGGGAPGAGARAITPDEVIAPGAEGAQDAPDGAGAGADDDGGEGEAGELLADVITEGVVTGTVKLTADALRKSKPPRRAADPNETMLTWYRDGVQFRLRRMLGRAGTLSPTAKMFVGGAGVVVSMWAGAEAIDVPASPGAPAPAAAAPSAPAPASPPAGSAPGADDEDEGGGDAETPGAPVAALASATGRWR